MNLNEFFIKLSGGSGSGNFGHSGRLGKRGGSMSKGSGSTPNFPPMGTPFFRTRLDQQKEIKKLEKEIQINNYTLKKYYGIDGNNPPEKILNPSAGHLIESVKNLSKKLDDIKNNSIIGEES